MRNIFLKNHTQNEAAKLLSDPLDKNQKRAYLWIKSLKCYNFIFIVRPRQGLPKFIKTKVLIT